MNFFGGEQKQQQQGPDPVVAATIEMQMYTGASQFLVVRESGSCITTVPFQTIAILSC
jgi:hypothetical protein